MARSSAFSPRWGTWTQTLCPARFVSTSERFSQYPSVSKGSRISALRFEQAAALRDRINAISALSKKQTVIAGLCADTDIWGLYRGAGKCCYAHCVQGLAGLEPPAEGAEVLRAVIGPLVDHGKPGRPGPTRMASPSAGVHPTLKGGGP